ncbi:MAG: ABC transporter ATP-binding protein [Planctomycetes bacterium]|nr:ABC transporter ATP-binding protein [Planctomycetota bacterium]
MLEVRNLGKLYGATPALDGVSFTVGTGEMFGLLGPNGAGKTTLMSIVCGLLDPSAGQVFLDGREFHRRDRELRRIIGIVPQDLAIYNELTARENLRFFGQLYSIPVTELETRVERILASIGLSDRADHRAGTFSGGMKRRLNLGASLVHEPKILLLDEPTAGVDPQSRNHIFEEVRRLNTQGITIVYTSHYMEEVQALCPRVGIIDHGKLIACDAVKTLLGRLASSLKFSAREIPATALSRLQSLANVKVATPNAQAVEIECQDVKQTLLQVVSILHEEQVEMTSLETAEPNLERVFLHLTGRALRD